MCAPRTSSARVPTQSLALYALAFNRSGGANCCECPQFLSAFTQVSFRPCSMRSDQHQIYELAR